jgi:fatty-acyl-CoA synthase
MGSPLVLLRHFDPEAVLAAIERHKVTHMFGAPAMFLFMSQHPAFSKTDLSSIDILIVGAAHQLLSRLWFNRDKSLCIVPWATALFGETWVGRSSTRTHRYSHC